MKVPILLEPHAVELREHGRKRRKQRVRGKVAGFLLCLLALVEQLDFYLFQRFDFGDPDVNATIYFASFLALYFGLSLFSGIKTPVVYLRRFGLTESNRPIAEAVKSLKLGSAYRFVTLDDSKFEPLGAPRWWLAVSVAAPIVIALLLIEFYNFLEPLLTMPRSEFETLDVLPRKIAEATFREEGFTGQLISSFGLGLTTLVVKLTIGLLAIFASIHFLRVHARTHMKAESRTDLRKILRRVLRLSSLLRGHRLMDSQVTVVSVVDTLWQRAVQSLIGRIDNVLIDVSMPTGHILWEVEQLSRVNFRQCLLIGDEQMVRGWLDAAQNGNDPKGVLASMMTTLSNRTILLYTPDQGHRRAFIDALHRALDNVTDFPKCASESKLDLLASRALLVLQTSFVYLLATGAWFMIATAWLAKS